MDETEWDDYLEQLEQRADQLLNMLDDLLELANLKALRLPPKPVAVNVATILEEVSRKLRPAAEAKGLNFEVQIQARPVVKAQPAHLQSLWTHLISNAIHYTPNGSIRVSLEEQDGQIVGTVADTGIGISTEELSRIFQEFYRSEAAREQVPLGTGLGLPIVNQILKLYGGTIQVDSTPGQGSSFRFRLPSVPWEVGK